MSSERILCKSCLDETNHPPPEFPPDWDGYCPKCAVTAMIRGEITKVDAEMLLPQAVSSVEKILSKVLGTDVMLVPEPMEYGTMVPTGESDGNMQQFITWQCLN